MKKAIFVLAFAAILVVAVVPSAFALHSGYAATTTSCKSCHSVHQGSGNELFISGTKTKAIPGTSGSVTLSTSSIEQDLCFYCHVFGTTHATYQNGLTKAASGFTSMHEIGSSVTTTPPDGVTSAQTTGRDGVPGLGCLDCHDALPHSAKNSGLTITTADAKVHNVYTQDLTINDFCSRCHSNNADATRIANGQTHPLVAAGTNDFNTTMYGAQTIAWSDATSCTSCHKTASLHNSGTVNGSVISTDVAFTSYGTGVNYSGTNVNTIGDGECLSCHQNSDATAGVSITY
jgi:hypothetical protein